MKKSAVPSCEFVTVRIESEMLDQIRAYSEVSGIAIYDIINDAIREHVECVIRARMQVRSMDAGGEAA